jgi:hypothetical protein
MYVYADSMWRGGEGLDSFWKPDSEHTKLPAHFKNNSLGGGGAQTDKTAAAKAYCRLLLKQIDFSLPSMSFIFLWGYTFTEFKLLVDFLQCPLQPGCPVREQ